MLRKCLPAGQTGAFHKIDGIKRKENYVDNILKHHHKTSASLVPHRGQINNDLRLTSKFVAKWPKDKVPSKAITKPWPQCNRKFVGTIEKVCTYKKALQSWLNYSSSAWRNRPKSVRSLRKAKPKNILPPNTRNRYVHFRPTGTMMSGIKQNKSENESFSTIPFHTLATKKTKIVLSHWLC